MKNSRLTIVNTILLVAILGYIVVGNLGNSSSSDEAYVVTTELFSEFDYAKELDAEFVNEKEAKEGKLIIYRSDLISMENQIKSGNYNEDYYMDYQLLASKYQQAQIELEQELILINQSYSVKIWEKLNSYISEFGEKNNYKVIHGATGDGNILFADKNMNITADVIEFCNKKYSGR